jgi:dipeptidyl aminopeptidase/acylaminoacyl peptidase
VWRTRSLRGQQAAIALLAASAALALLAGAAPAAPPPTGRPTGAPDRALSTGHVHVVSVAGRVPRALSPGADPVVSPDGRLIAYVRDGQIWLMRPDGSEQRRLTTTVGGRPIWSPDGRRLVFTVWNLDPCYPPPQTKCAITDIWTVNVDGSGERKLFERALQPAWSPTGQRLLFREFLGPAEADMGVGDLKIAWPDGSHERTLFPGPSYDGTSSQPAWSPNGKWIVFERTPWSDLQHRLYLIRADGSHLHRLTGGTYPAWSPNGKLIAFTRRAMSGVWVMPAAGGKPRRISPAGSCPTWSPGGKRLALLTTVYGRPKEPAGPPQINTSLSVVGPDGHRRRKLAVASPCVFESSFPSPPSWSRDGLRIYFSG